MAPTPGTFEMVGWLRFYKDRLHRGTDDDLLNTRVGIECQAVLLVRPVHPLASSTGVK